MNRPIPKPTLWCCMAGAAALLQFPSIAHADAASDLQAQLDALQKKVDALERRPAAPDSAASSNTVTGGATKGSFKLPGSNTSVTLGGYVKLDAIYSDRSAGVGSTGDQEYEAGSVPIGAAAVDNERNQVKLHARQSRLYAQTSTPTSWGDLTTYLEFDLFGASGNETVSNSNGLRVRHAYGTLGHLLAGQTWTTFSDPAVYPETLDFGGPAGQIFARQAQLRWTQPWSFGASAQGLWSLALENPETIAALPNGDSFRADDDRFPDIAGNIKFETASGHYSLAAVARQLRVDSAAAPASREQKWGGGFGVNGVVPLAGKDDVRFSAYYGNAIGRYSVGFFPDAVLDGDGHIALARQWIALAALRHWWTPTLRSTLALSGLGSHNPEGTAGTVNKAAQSAHLNMIWSPVPQANLGVEYLTAGREIENGQRGRLNRLQMSAQYLF